MTMAQPQSEVELELEPAKRALRRANAFVLANLPKLMDVSRLREGDDEDDYFIDVPPRRLYDVGEPVAHLENLAIERFNVGLGVMPIPRRELRAAS